MTEIQKPWQFLKPEKRKNPTPKQRAEVFAKDNGLCYLCGMKIQAHLGEKWEVEHVIRIENGGSNTLSNLRVAHVDCHKQKSKSERTASAKDRRIRAKFIGAHKPERPFKKSKFKRKVDGTVVLREK